MTARDERWTISAALGHARTVRMWVTPAAHPSPVTFSVPKRALREASGNNLRNLNNSDLCTWAYDPKLRVLSIMWAT